MSDDALPVINIDELQHNRDWLRRRWDTLPTTTPDLERLLRVLWMTTEQFQRTTVYLSNVDQMPWLRSVRGYDDQRRDNGQPELVPWPSGPIDKPHENRFQDSTARRFPPETADPVQPISAYGQWKYAAYCQLQEDLARPPQRATREREKVRRHNEARLARRRQEGKE